MALRNMRFAQLILAIFPITLALAGCIGAAAQCQSTATCASRTLRSLLMGSSYQCHRYFFAFS